MKVQYCTPVYIHQPIHRQCLTWCVITRQCGIMFCASHYQIHCMILWPSYYTVLRIWFNKFYLSKMEMIKMEVPSLPFWNKIPLFYSEWFYCSIVKTSFVQINLICSLYHIPYKSPKHFEISFWSARLCSTLHY